MPDSDILKEAKGLLNKSNVNSSFNAGSSKSKRGKSVEHSKYGANLCNEWIPTDAVRAI